MDSIAEYKEQIRDFMENHTGDEAGPASLRYKTQLLSNPPPRRLLVSVSDVRRYRKELSSVLLEKALSILPEFEKTAHEMAESPVKVGFCGALGENHHTPRTLSSRDLGKLVSVDGIVTTSSIVRPKITRSVHYNPASKTFSHKEYRDTSMITPLPPTSITIPSKSAEGNPIELEYGLSTYIDHQKVVLQEMPETSPAGQLPRTVFVVLEEDLSDKIKPGDRVRVFGVYKCISNISAFPERLRTAIVANHAEKLGEEQLKMHENDAPRFKKLSESPSLLQEVTRSIAPSIYGHDNAKAAIALMLFGGNPVDLQSGGRIRGDINILLVGDPGVAKSQLLRYVLGASPLAVGATGRGASGVGLTAAVTVDQDTGEKRVEAGAMVLADSGIVCIDEFDKMDDGERAALHEAMEQQTVTIAKAGLHVTLGARCSVLAAANPATGQYRTHLPPKDNIRLPESLLTRFDLIFIMKDTNAFDAEIAEHVLKKRSGTDETEEVDSKEEVPYIGDGAIEQAFLRRYIHHCKQIVPLLEEETCLFISNAYVSLRREGSEHRRKLTRGVTARVLETIIRLSTAHAKMRMSPSVSISDAEVAVAMVSATLFTSKDKKPQAPALVPLFDRIIDQLTLFKEKHPHDSFLSLPSLLRQLSEEQEAVLPILKDLESDGVLTLHDNFIIFTE